ncbi:MAG: ComEC/Rec2 family competence protein, partial [Bacteroidota bacterium]
MKLLEFIPVRLSIFLAFGILLGEYLQISAIYALLINCLLLAVLALLFSSKYRRRSMRFGIVVFSLTTSMGVYLSGYSYDTERQQHYSEFDNQGVHFWYVRISKKLKKTAFYNRYYAEVIALDSLKRSGRILLTKSLAEEGPDFQVDDEILVLTTVIEFRNPMNPHQFNFRNYMKKQGIVHQIRLDSRNHRLIKRELTTLKGLAASVRRTIVQKLESRGFGKSELSIIQALLLGDRMEISRDTYESYQRSGAVHLLAVSGLHIGIVLLILKFLLRPLQYLSWGKRLQLPIILFALWSFALLAGFSPSVIRAVSMFSFIAYAMSLNRPNDIYNTLALSVLFILMAFDPLLLFQPGFQMSYAAVIAIVSVYPHLMKFWLPGNIIVRRIWQLSSVSLAAQLGVLPISLYYFHQFPALFLGAGAPPSEWMSAI